MARRQEILLTSDVLKLGNMGDTVRVTAGYARNYLFPYALAIPVGMAAKRQIEVLRERAAKSEGEREVKATALKKRMAGVSVQIAARVAHDTELFGSIGTREIVVALAKTGVEIDGKQVHLNDKIKKLGRYQVEISLHKNVIVTVTVEVVNSDPNAPSLDETLAAAVAAKAPKTADADTAEPTAAVVAAPAAAEPVADDAGRKPRKIEMKIKNLGKVADPAKPAAVADAKPAKSKK